MIRRMTLKKVAYDILVTEEQLIDGKWEFVFGYNNPRFEDLPGAAQKRHPRKRLHDGDSYSFYFITSDDFPHPAHIGRGWVNPQGEQRR